MKDEMTLERVRNGIEVLLDGCFCDDGRGYPECNTCIHLRKALSEVNEAISDKRRKPLTCKELIDLEAKHTCTIR